MPLSDAAVHSMLADFVGKATPAHEVTHLSLHDADPGDTGANEVSASRVAVTEADFTAPAARAVETDNDKTFSGTPDQSVSHFGCWDAATDGNFLGGGSLTGDLAFNSEGELILKAGTSIEIN